MNGVHDMGGLQGFGDVAPETDEPVFHEAWERRAFALTLAMAPAGGWNLDMSRHARESLPPAQYLSSTYYEIWLAALERLMTERSLVSGQEIAEGRSIEPPAKVVRVLSAEDVPAVLARGASTERDAPGTAGFAVGDAVRACNINPPGHTRLPRYARGRRGTVTHVHGCHVFPDAHAHGLGERPQWLYGVSFAARELWGPEAAAGDAVNIDLWEPYLERA